MHLKLYEHSTRPTNHHRGVSMSAVSNTIMMPNTSGSASTAAMVSDTSAPPSAAHNSNSTNAVDGVNVSASQKSQQTSPQQLTTTESNISGNLSSNSSINTASVKSSGSKTTETGTVKRKALSSSRQKKFHRHFQQVDADEEVINCKLFIIIDCILSNDGWL